MSADRVHLLLVLCSWMMQGGVAELSLPGLPATVSLPENSPAGTPVHVFRVTVLTPGVSMETGFPAIVNPDPLTTAFTVSMSNVSHALVSVTGTSELDFESLANRFVLHMVALDSGGDSVMETLTVALQDEDEPPAFHHEETTLYIVEKSPPGNLYFPSVSDPEDKPLTFSLSPTTPGFDIDPASGVIFTTKQFDYQTDPTSYILNISVSDGTHTVWRMLTVHVLNTHDNKPTFLNEITSFILPEELTPGFIVANITAVVSDLEDGYIMYTITDNEYLSIDTYSGVLWVSGRMDRDSGPLRDHPTLGLTVTATLGGHSEPLPLTNTLTLDVTVTDINDHAPVCVPAASRVELLETAEAESVVTTVTCTDNDVELSFTQYELTGLSCLDCRMIFALDETKTPSHIVLTAALDFELEGNLLDKHEYRLMVSARDKNHTSLTGSAFVFVTVTAVNEFPPVFNTASYFFSVSELLDRGAVIGSVSATDEDLPPTPITYTLVSAGGAGAASSNIFFVDPGRGCIRLLTRPDYETTRSYRLLIRASDGDARRPLSATATVTINITEANDEPPLCGPNRTTLMVPKGQKSGSNVQGFMLSCTDKDSPPQSFIYTISGGSNLNNHFVFSPSAGSNVSRLLLNEPYNFEGGADTVWRYSLTVLVSDGNLRGAGRGARSVAPPGHRAARTQTGTVIIDIQVYDPDLVTVITTTTPRVTYVTLTENTFSMADWYVWFVMALGLMLLLPLLLYLLYCCCRWLSRLDLSCCEPRPKLLTEAESVQSDVFLEVTKIHTVFDGEEVDPVSNRVYEYNSKSGARRWKDHSVAPSLPGGSVLMTSSRSTLMTSQAETGPAQQPPRSKSAGGEAANTIGRSDHVTASDA